MAQKIYVGDRFQICWNWRIAARIYSARPQQRENADSSFFKNLFIPL